MKKIIKILLSIPGFKWQFALFITAIVIAQGFALQILPIIDKEVTSIIEKQITTGTFPQEKFFYLFLIAAGAIILNQTFERVSWFIANIFREKVWMKIFKEGFSKLLYHDIEYLSQERSGEYLNKLVRASGKISSLFTESASVLFRNLVKALVSIAIIGTISLPIAIMIFGTLIIYTVIFAIRFKHDLPLAKQRDKFDDKEFSRVWEVLPQIQLIKTFTNEKKELAKIDYIANELVKNQTKREKLWIYADAVKIPLVALPTLAIKFYAAYLALQGQFGIATFALIYTLISAVQEPMWVINWFMWEAQSMLHRAKKYLAILDSKEKILNPIKPIKFKNPSGDIIFDKLSFDYEHGKKDVLKNISLKFASKKTTALVGKSGVGKSTIINLICRFYDPTKGEITIGGTDIKSLKKEDLRSQIGSVMQESYIFSGSVADNMRYAKENASNAKIISSLKKAKAWQFVKDLPKGIHTQIGERGIKLSGGQKQRLSIARTILKNPKILILDEATNALDSESEVLVQETLEKFVLDKTVIIIAHRLSTIQKADLIYLIDDGRVKEQGTHQELLKLNGTYKMLHDIQAGGFDEQKRVMEEYELG